MASETLSPAALHKSAQFGESAPTLFGVASMKVTGAQHGQWCDAHRQLGGTVARRFVRQSRTARCQHSRAATISRLTDHAGRPHLPAVRRVQITGGVEVFGDQRRVLLHRALAHDCSIAVGQAPMPFAATGFQLRFVGHGADQGVVEGVLGGRGVLHLIDQLGVQQLGEFGRRRRARSGDSALKRSPITDAAFNVCRAAGSNRSIRAAMAACTVAGTVTSETSPRQR